MTNPAYPNGQCTACGQGLTDAGACQNIDCAEHEVTEIFIVAWSGGYEEASYAAKPDEESAREQFESWKSDAKIDQGDSVDLLRINLSTMAIEALERV